MKYEVKVSALARTYAQVGSSQPAASRSAAVPARRALASRATGADARTSS